MDRSRTEPKWNEGKRKEERGEAVELGGGGTGRRRGWVGASERSDLYGGGGCDALLGGG